MASTAISAHLRTGKQRISDEWERSVRAELPALRALDRPSLIDHLPEFMDGLALYVEGEIEAARPRFEALVQGHALQRLGYGIGLETLTREYALLRAAILRDCLSVPSQPGVVEAMIVVNEGIDEAVNEAVHRYAAQRDKGRDRFIGILAHDLRNPLGSIHMATARIVADTAGRDDRSFRAASMISRNAERMTRMIDDVIEFARGYLGAGIPLELRPGDMGDLCREAVEELRSAHPTRDIQVAAHGDLRGSWDHDRVVQALSNLVGNAIQHGTDPVTVATEEAPDRRSLITTVINPGAPIPPAELAHLFDPFRNGARKPRAGLGLGLYIVKQIATAHGATIDIVSNEQATTVTIRWPRTPLEETPGRA